MEPCVVVAFSGHGSETHQLVAYDTDPYDIPGTSIPLTTLGEWCARISCRRLLIVLDCCFPGGMGAKALQVDARARSLESVGAELNRISGVKWWTRLTCWRPFPLTLYRRRMYVFT